MSKQHDSFIKKALSRRKVSVEFLRNYLPKELSEMIDFKSLEQYKNDLLSNSLGEGVVDILYLAKFKDQSLYLPLFILLEHQSSNDKYIAFRIQKYMLRVCDEHLRRNPNSKLPLVYSAVLYTGKERCNFPKSFYELFEDKKLAKQFFTQDLKVIDVSKLEDKNLLQQYYAGIMLYVAKHIRSNDIKQHLIRVEKLLEFIVKQDYGYLEDIFYYVTYKGEGDEEVLSFFQNIVPENKKGKIMTIAERLVEKGRIEGIEKGKLEGIEKGKLEVAQKLLRTCSAEEVAEIVDLPLKTIQSLN